MMVKVILHWELPQALQERFAAKKMFIRWSHTCKAFGVNELILINVDDLDCNYGDSEIKLTVVPTLDEALRRTRGSRVIYVEEGGEPIEGFTHPENCVYIFGSDFGELPQSDVGITTKNALNAEVALGVVLYERSKQWP
jgi:hypothetical protein